MAVVISRPSGFQNGSDDFSGFRVLVLDPFIGTRRIVTDMLIRDMRVGGVETCSTVEEALHLLEDASFNVLFTDWSADVDALQLTAQLRSPDSSNRFLPIVVMTAYNSEEHVRQARDAGITEFMVKPFSAMVLQSRLRGVARANRAYVQSNDYFGPDRRHHALAWTRGERRRSSRYADRRQRYVPIRGPERRQGAFTAGRRPSREPPPSPPVG